MATGTHGTGAALGSLSTFARGFRLIGADGRPRWCDAETEPGLFEAQRLSLGLFGIATEIGTAVVPAFPLAERIEKRRWADVRETYARLARHTRHTQLSFFPHPARVTPKPPPPS